MRKNGPAGGLAIVLLGIALAQLIHKSVDWSGKAWPYGFMFWLLTMVGVGVAHIAKRNGFRSGTLWSVLAGFVILAIDSYFWYWPELASGKDGVLGLNKGPMALWTSLGTMLAIYLGLPLFGASLTKERNGLKTPSREEQVTDAVGDALDGAQDIFDALKHK